MTQSCRVESGGSARCRRLWEMERRYVGDAWHDGMTIVGVDEAGRGCLAGPVVAAAVVLGKPVHTWVGIDDSKCLTRRRREQLCDWIREQARAVGVGWASVEEIDNLNILHASRLAMTRAVQCLPVQPDVTLVDGPYAPLEAPPEWHCQPVIDGDAQCLSIAAASIVAKVVRDRFMAELANTYPEFGFDRNAGYGTREHRQALARFGPTPYHRRSFAPVAQHMQMRLALDG
ncbi:MAG: ribonuclease HII [Alicyclobacillus herbarius]|uniref:ribonuclease HII n=1 Tax=Alicyclobacillus herbarius TaxID=122960 RepID=UPI00235440B3|nr:ribonuclease HII [Alicyclobacillus herbarius]MCL6632339.1 ribonuclease HII [Alicyclobacillus herbarius]